LGSAASEKPEKYFNYLLLIKIFVEWFCWVARNRFFDG
jgi:hypothetical protein